jgi:hypothetical protein
MACYEYDGSKVKITLVGLFKGGETGVWKVISTMGRDDRQRAIQFSKDADGVITGRVVKIASKLQSVSKEPQTAKLQVG